MAGIEKIDELTGEYPSYHMYRYKRNHIQVCPWNRKAFQGQKHLLVISKERVWYKDGYYYPSFMDEITSGDIIYVHKGSGNGWYKKSGYYKYVHKPYTDKEYAHLRVRPIQEYHICLYVPDLQGNVRGFYYNETSDLPALKRKLKRMLKCKKLNVLNLNYTEIKEELVTQAYNKIYGE